MNRSSQVHFLRHLILQSTAQSDGNNFCQTQLDDEGSFPSIQTVPANGVWILKVEDTFGGDAGTVHAFSLITSFLQTNCLSPSTNNVHTLTASVNGVGTITPTGAVVVADGANMTFLIQAQAYYHIADIQTNGVSVGGSFQSNLSKLIYTLSNVTANLSLQALIEDNRTSNNVPEIWLVMHGLTNGNFNSTELLDSDNDGLLNWKEFVAGTDPTNAASVFKLTDTQENLVRWFSVSGETYFVNASTNLLGTFSSPLGSNILATPPQNTYTDSPVGSIKFYQVGVDP
ncbi:MAG: hypothetical protein GKR87_10660 [Kiritimatiellae bacterium]|nr:hypothetical protein [Kiritimatiellia bacterium]